MRVQRRCCDRSDEMSHDEREIELARTITTTPAVMPWMIFTKIEVLEYYLGFDGGTTWSDNRRVGNAGGDQS